MCMVDFLINTDCYVRDNTITTVIIEAIFDLLTANNRLSLIVAKDPAKAFSSTPSIIWFINAYGFTSEQSLELLSIAGMLIAWFAMITPRVRNAATYFALWIFYLSIYKVRTICRIC